MEKAKKLLSELKEEYNKCEELFNIAWELNDDKKTRTVFTQKVTTYLPNVMQTLSAVIGEVERDIIQCEISEEADELDAEYESM